MWYTAQNKEKNTHNTKKYTMASIDDWRGDERVDGRGGGGRGCGGFYW